ncbi:SpoIIE family protein phosphatase [Streptomyces sp. CB01373]|uniref:SpoIIE family protein phosphatase n=1 Tax=Streptomyces sp. CB01373 TaxID=2020325 RepID=UPI000C276230|nr:SpoIIE family protein phosphatase [Streptomyces sp. CB01373]PJM92130.1 hypothetical protein CG719_30360 [Streptomyces sp. CB01373]
MSAVPCRIVLVGTDETSDATVRRSFADQAEVISLADTSCARAALHQAQEADVPRPTLLVVGPRVTDPVGLTTALEARAADWAVIVLTDHDDMAPLPLLYSPYQVRRVPLGDAHRLPETVRGMLEQLTRQHHYRAAQAAAQRQLASTHEVSRQPGEHLFGPLLHQALIGALALDGDGRITAWNRKAADLLALTSDDALHVFLVDYFPAIARRRLSRHLAAAAHGIGPSELFERADGDHRQVLRLSPQQVTNHEGHRQTLLLLEDVSAETAARSELAMHTSHALLSSDVAAAMTAGCPLAERLQRVTQAVVDRLDAASAHIWTLDPPRDVLRLEAGAGPCPCPNDDLSRVRVGEHEIGMIAAECRPHLAKTGDLQVSDREWTRREGMAAFAGYPLVADGELMGVMALFARHPLPGATLDALVGIADRISAGIRQDLLLRRLHATAEDLQRPLLPPRLPRIPGFDIAARYRPHNDSLQIGGDFYDVFPVSGGRWVLTLGDVCGKGPAAAAVTGLVRHTLWAAAWQDPHPGHVLALLHHALKRADTPFCTLVYTVLDPGPLPARLRVVRAGHPAPLLRRGDGTTCPMGAAGPVLGVLDTLDHPVEDIDLGPGDSMILYTDGFTEGSGSYRARDPEDLAALLDGLPPGLGDRPADRLAEELLKDACIRWKDRLRDDLAVLALTVRPRTGAGTADNSSTAETEPPP